MKLNQLLNKMHFFVFFTGYTICVEIVKTSENNNTKILSKNNTIILFELIGK